MFIEDIEVEEQVCNGGCFIACQSKNKKKRYIAITTFS